ncbi:Putative transcription factor bHLH107 [Linum perenne]
MFADFHNSNYSAYGSGNFTATDHLPAFSRGGSSAAAAALVLDSERGELVKAPAKVAGKKEVSEEKALAALKSHSEAERRRRERINAHLATLRGLVPCTEKVRLLLRCSTFCR